MAETVPTPRLRAAASRPGLRSFAACAIACAAPGGAAQVWAAQASAAQDSPGQIPALIAIALDTSGSVRPEALEPTIGLATRVLDALPPGSQCAVFTFDDVPRLALSRTANRSEIRRALERATATGQYTALHDALFDASRYLVEAPPSRKAILLLTDGKDENSALVLEDALAAARGAEIPVFAVGIGAVRERELRRIAKLTGGAYAPLAQASGARIASRILALERSGSTRGVAGPSAGASAGASAEPSAAPAAPEDSAGRSFLWFLAAVFAALLTVVVGSIITLRRRDLARSAPPSRRTNRGPSPTVRRNENAADAPRTLLLQTRPALAIISGPGNGRVFPLDDAIGASIGRSSGCEVDLDDLSISSQHCRIQSEDGLWVLHDLDSTNGTFVNEREIKRYELASGDIIRVGETSLQFRTR